MIHVRARVRDDEGSVLIAVVGIMVVLTVLVIGAFGMASDNLLQSKRERGRAQALAVAEAGLEQIMWRFKANQLPDPNSVVKVDVPGMGMCTIQCSQTSSTNWHLVATGETTAVPGVSRTVSTDILAMSIWDMYFSKGIDANSNGSINGNGYFYGKAYMKGNWPPSRGSCNFNGGPFFVKGGDFQLDGNATMGDEGKCDLYCDGNVSMTNATINVFTSVPDLPMPPQKDAELATKRNAAYSESGDGLQGTPGGGYLTNEERRESGITTGVPTPLRPPFVDSSKVYDVPRDGSGKEQRYYKVIDDNSAVDSSVAEFYIGNDANGNRLPSFGQPYDPYLGHSTDDFSWDATLGVLTVQGTVFIDAKKVVIGDVKYAGKGVIVTSGDVEVSGKWEPYCLTLHPEWDKPKDSQYRADRKLMYDSPDGFPQKYLVGISSSGTVYEQSPKGYGIFYAAKGWTMDTGANGNEFYGNVVSPSITFVQNGHVECVDGMGENVPTAMPGGGGQIVALAGWHEGRN